MIGYIIEVDSLAKKARLIGRHRIDESKQFSARLVLLDVANVCIEVAQAKGANAFGKAVFDQILLTYLQIDAAHLIQPILYTSILLFC